MGSLWLVLLFLAGGFQPGIARRRHQGADQRIRFSATDAQRPQRQHSVQKIDGNERGEPVQGGHGLPMFSGTCTSFSPTRSMAANGS